MHTSHTADPRADLAFIRSVIEDSRRAIALDASPFLVWGLLVVLGVVVEYGLIAAGRSDATLWVWLGLMVSGWIFALHVWWRHRRSSGVTTLADRALGALWLSCWASMFLIGFGGAFAGVLEGRAIPAALAAVLGVGYQVTAVLVSSKGVSWFGAGWWLVSLTVFFWQSPLTLGFFGLAMLLLQVMPAAYYQRQWRLAG